MATLAVNFSGSGIAAANVSKNYTINDTDTQAIIDWSKIAFASEIQSTYNPSGNPSFVATNDQIMLIWIQSWINGTIDGVQRNQAVPASIPPPISIQ
jgi:hypothetical protein